MGSIFPDFDMIFFYFVDDRQYHHHRYWTHLPVYWFAISAALLLGFSRLRSCVSHVELAAVFIANVFLHLVLDTIVGDIWWLYPFVDRPYRLAIVPALYHPWWLNFILHWSFAIETIIIGAALGTYCKKTVKR